MNLSNYINEEVDLANLMQSLLDSYRMWIAQHPDDTISQLSTQKRLDEAISEVRSTGPVYCCIQKFVIFVCTYILICILTGDCFSG